MEILSKKRESAHLYAFDQTIDNSTIVALGEDVHTSEGFYNLKFQLIKHMILNNGYRGILFEDNRSTGEAINNYLVYGQGNVEDVVRKLYGVWHSKSVLDMVNWIRDYNIKNPHDMVKFYGIDAQQPQDDIKVVEQFLIKQKNNNGSSIVNIAACNKFINHKNEGKKRDLDKCLTSIDKLNKYIQENRSTIKNSNPDSVSLVKTTLPSLIAVPSTVYVIPAVSKPTN